MKPSITDVNYGAVVVAVAHVLQKNKFPRFSGAFSGYSSSRIVPTFVRRSTCGSAASRGRDHRGGRQREEIFEFHPASFVQNFFSRPSSLIQYWRFRMAFDSVLDL